METRRARIKVGTLKPKAQARAEREARKNGSQAQTTKDKIQPVVFDAEAADAKYHSQLLDDLIAEKITQEEMKELRIKGRPTDKNSKGGQSAGGLVGAVGGDIPTSTKPGDFVQDAGWVKAGPDLKEIRKKLNHKKYVLKLMEGDDSTTSEQLEMQKAAVKEWIEKHQAALPTHTKLDQHDKEINDLKWQSENAEQQIGKGRSQIEWWTDQVQEQIDAKAVTDDKLVKAIEAKKQFMLAEGIEENKENN